MVFPTILCQQALTVHQGLNYTPIFPKMRKKNYPLFTKMPQNKKLILEQLSRSMPA